MLFGAIEAGGTKFVCAVGDETLTIKERISIPTTTPEETMAKVFQFFDQYQLKSIGIGSFGPIDVNEASDTYGNITTTPKVAWQHYPFLTAVKERYRVPVAWTTDVNAAAYGELHAGAGRGHRSCVYITVGTGIGGGVVVDGNIMHGFGHPELGHIIVRRHEQDTYAGTCPFHGDCLEGLAAGPAIEARFGVKAQELDTAHEAWDIEAYYLAQAVMNYTLVLSPEKIIFGGGVMKQQQLYPLMRTHFEKLMNNYVQTPDFDNYVVPCELKDDAGITGCLLLAMDEISKKMEHLHF